VTIGCVSVTFELYKAVFCSSVAVFLDLPPSSEFNPTNPHILNQSRHYFQHLDQRPAVRQDGWKSRRRLLHGLSPRSPRIQPRSHNFSIWNKLTESAFSWLRATRMLRVSCTRRLVSAQRSNQETGAAVLAHSLRDSGTKKKLAVLITPDTLRSATVTELKVLRSKASSKTED
jgi:hypothetical protein